MEVVLREADAARTAGQEDGEARQRRGGASVRLTHRVEKDRNVPLRRRDQTARGRSNEDDNQLEAVVEVRTDKIKVLLVQSLPNFEYRYLKHMLGRDETIELKCVLQEADQDYPRIDASVTTIFP